MQRITPGTRDFSIPRFLSICILCILTWFVLAGVVPTHVFAESDDTGGIENTDTPQENITDDVTEPEEQTDSEEESPGPDEEPAESVDPEEPEEPTEEPTDPDEELTPEEPTDPEEEQTPEEPTDPEEPGESADPAEPEEPGEPADPAEPEEPTEEPTDPDEELTPEEPTDPDEELTPEEPTDPEEPGESADPAEPEEPGEPADPEEPGEPADPEEPGEPTGPDEELTPEEPEETDPDDSDDPDEESEEPEETDPDDSDDLDEEPEEPGIALTTAATLFSDTPEDEWYVVDGYLDYVVTHGLMIGYTGTDRFGPEDNITRADVLVILYRIANPDSTATTDSASFGTTTHFSDVAKGLYYTAAVEWAYQNGITTGYFGTGKFGPEDPITREDLATMLCRFAQRYGASTSSLLSISSFPDASSVSSYATTAVRWCYTHGIMTGNTATTPALLKPQDNATRAEAAKMFTVLVRDVIAGSSMQELSWSLTGLTQASSYIIAGKSVKVTPKISGSASGLTYEYAWYTSSDTCYFGSSSDSSYSFKLSNPGTYTLCVMVSDSSGVSFLKTCTVTVWDFTSLSTSSSNNTATWKVTPSVTTSGSTSDFTYTYVWYEGSDLSEATQVGSKENSSKTSYSVTFETEDYYWFSVTVTDPDGHSKTQTTRVLYSPSGKIGYQNPSYMWQVSSYNVAANPNATGIFAYMTPSRIDADATREECVEAFIARAYEYLGTPYVWDYACAPGVGVDCIGLVYQCAYAVGMDMGEFNPYDHYATGSSGWHSHDATNVWNYGSIMRLDISERQRGDLIFYSGHVAIYIGNDQVIQALPSSGVHIASIWSYGTPIGVGRLFS